MSLLSVGIVLLHAPDVTLILVSLHRNVFFLPPQVATKVGLQNVKLVVAGGAPCPPYLLEFVHCLTGGAVVLQGYGMTESG
jgi:long-subunit acyl-CoA synthetase (AMP-forming)